ncbi:Brix-domain-containing protein [Rhizophagus irregularis]|uniref:Brix-domain-containing protein n=1 Tax=Rhizophagus irregularis TaxID=588596 RepID=A0A2I1ESZ9_9GLOM|nr:Brix-domain-containing protein [Rhizophagus irregularis]PKC62628.1 Brix-domain-containing protein [Rhizophagus irregularis]PKK70082.1 Brix-domain-containing protein [Rhizophagus irregularis]PKY25250.1 Brix-domain-containing protein [Rhizophagus irregularis]PKY40370.1 Brix-domain-containing protein [Rhizophagus irregularis]
MNSILPSQIKNKIKREEVHARQRQEKNRRKLELRLQRRKEEAEDPSKKEERLAKNVPKTLENTREFDETIVDAEDTEVFEDEASDEFSSYFKGISPKMLITTSKRPSKFAYEFASELIDIFPNSQFVKRGSKFSIKQIIGFCTNRDYTDVLVVNEDKKVPYAITLIHLPDGPTAYFKLTSIKLNHEIQGHGRSSCHKPELILNNFNTRLGHTIGRWLQALFPHVPEFQGRQVATFHNQRDFIFFRRHRYVFKSKDKAELQEIGPRFTLKLKWLQRGAFDKDGEYEWMFKPDLETSRRRFFL